MKQWLFPLVMVSFLGCEPEEREETSNGDSTDGPDTGTAPDPSKPGGDDSTGTGGGGTDAKDAYCDHAWNGFEQLDRFLELSALLSSDPDLSGAAVRENGALTVEAAEGIALHFGRAQEFVIDSDTTAAFDALLLHQEKWMLPLAELAATAADLQAYEKAAFELLLEPGVAEASANGAIASGTISAYTLERCGTVRRPS